MEPPFLTFLVPGAWCIIITIFILNNNAPCCSIAFYFRTTSHTLRRTCVKAKLCAAEPDAHEPPGTSKSGYAILNRNSLDTAAVGVAEHTTDKPIRRNKCQVLAPLSVAVNVAGVFASSLLFMPLRSRLLRSNK